MKKVFLAFFLIILLGGLFFPLAGQAAGIYQADGIDICYEGLVPCGIGKPYWMNGKVADGKCEGIKIAEGVHCQLCHLFVMFKAVIDFVLRLVVIIAVLMIVIAGIYYFAAVGDPGKIGQATGILKTTVLGLVIIFGSWIFVSAFFLAVGVEKWTELKDIKTKGWYIIDCPITLVAPDPIDPIDPTISPLVLNSASGKSCDDICAEKGMRCESIGTDSGATNKKYFYMTMATKNCIEISGGCEAEMKSQPEAAKCKAIRAQWTNCYCSPVEPVETFKLTVILSGGSGLITGNGINCGVGIYNHAETCFAHYEEGNKVILESQQNIATTWENCDEIFGDFTCEVEMNENKTIKANFSDDQAI